MTDHEMLELLVQKVTGLEQKITGLDHLEQTVTGLDQKLTGVGHTVTNLDQKVTGLDKRLIGLEQKFTGLDQKVTGLDQKVSGMDQRLTGLDQKVSGIEKDVKFIKVQQSEHGEMIQSLVHSGEVQKARHDALQMEVAKLSGGIRQGFSDLVEAQKSLFEMYGEHETKIRTLGRRPV